jgi:hypothetical protein
LNSNKADKITDSERVVMLDLVGVHPGIKVNARKILKKNFGF